MSEINDIEQIPKGDFTIILKLIARYQRTEPGLMAKYKYGMYHIGSFRGGSNKNINLITCEDKIVIQPIIQSYVLYWYHLYLLHPEMDRTEATILQNVYWSGIRNSVRKEVNNCDTNQRTKQTNIKYG